MKQEGIIWKNTQTPPVVERKLASQERDAVIDIARDIFSENSVRYGTTAYESIRLAEAFYRTSMSYRQESFTK